MTIQTAFHAYAQTVIKANRAHFAMHGSSAIKQTSAGLIVAFLKPDSEEWETVGNYESLFPRAPVLCTDADLRAVPNGSPDSFAHLAYLYEPFSSPQYRETLYKCAGIASAKSLCIVEARTAGTMVAPFYIADRVTRAEIERFGGVPASGFVAGFLKGE